MPPMLIFPAVVARSPVMTSASSRWPFPATPAIPRISPAHTSSVTSFSASVPRSPRARDSLQLENDRARFLCELGGRRERNLATHHQAGKMVGVGTGGRHGGDRAALTQDRHAVGDREDLGQLVGDEDHRPPGGGHVAHAGEEPIGLLRREHGGRLVENEDLCAAVEGFQDLDPLALPERQLPDPRPRIDGHLEAIGRLGNRLLDCPR